MQNVEGDSEPLKPEGLLCRYFATSESAGLWPAGHDSAGLGLQGSGERSFILLPVRTSRLGSSERRGVYGV